MLGIGFVCLLVGGLLFGIGFVRYFWELCWSLGLSVCLFFVGIMLGIGFVCLFVCLFVCWLGDLCLALRLSVICGNYVGHWVCLFVGWVTYVW